MSKDPAFLFYSKDWIEGTIEMLPQEKGVYIDLLAHQHQKGSLPIETKRLCRLVCMQESDFILIWEHIKNKFIEIDNNEQQNGIPNGSLNGKRLVNKKMIEVIKKRKSDALSKRTSGIFASLIKNSLLTKNEIEYIKGKFKEIDFTSINEEDIKEYMYSWFTKSLPNGDNVVNQIFTKALPNGSPKNNQMVTSLEIAIENNNTSINTLNTNSNIIKKEYNTVTDSKDSNWETDKNNFISDEQMQMNYKTVYSLSREEVVEYINNFITQIELAQDYKDLKELRKHFKNWMNKKNPIGKFQKEVPQYNPKGYVVQTPMHLWDKNCEGEE